MPEEAVIAPPAPTTEELEAMAKSANAEFFDNERLDRHSPAKKKKEPKAEEKPAEPVAEKKDEPKPDDKPPEAKVEPAKEEPKEKKKPKAKIEERKVEVQPIEPDIDQVAEKVAEKLKKGETPPETKDPYASYPKEDRVVLERLAWLSQNDPSFKGRDLAAETVKFWKSEQEYIDRWQAQHPDEKFETNADEHRAFYARHEPDVSEDALTNAAIDMRVEQRTKIIEEKARKEQDSRLSQIEANEAMRHAESAIIESVHGAVSEMITTAVPAFSTIIGENGQITDAVLKKMEDEDPVAVEIINKEAQALQVRIQELSTVMYCGKYYRFDPRNPVHADILVAGDRLEKAILAKPTDEQLADGRRFMARADYQKHIAEINSRTASVQAKREAIDKFVDRVWTVGLDEIKAVLVHQSAKNVSGILELVDKRTKHLESKKASAAKKDEPKEGEKTEETQRKTPAKAPAAIASSSDLVNTKIPSPSAFEGDAKVIDNVMFG
jgi:hypothetical protein